MRECKPIIQPGFPKNCIKTKKNWPRKGGGPKFFDPPLGSFKFLQVIIPSLCFHLQDRRSGSELSKSPMGIAKLWRSAENARSCDDATKLKHQFSKDDFLASFKSRCVTKHSAGYRVHFCTSRNTVQEIE